MSQLETNISFVDDFNTKEALEILVMQNKDLSDRIKELEAQVGYLTELAHQ